MSQRDRALVRDLRAPEAPAPRAYQRGFLHGARAAVGAANHHLPAPFARQLGEWIGALENWAVNNRYGEHAPRPPWKDEP